MANIDHHVLISVDDHIVEPPNMFVGRLPRKYQDKEPRFITREDGANVWVYEGHHIETWALNAVAGRPQEEWGFEPQSYDDVRPGVYDVHARVKDMSANGVWAALNFPTFVGFAGSLFSLFAFRDSDQAMAMIRAYNDWHLESWCAEYPDRFIPCCIVPFFDLDLTARELRRLASRGCHAVLFMGSTHPWPSLFSDHWDPFWAECQELGTAVCMHLGAGASVLNMVESIEDAPPLPAPTPRPMALGHVGVNAAHGSPAAVAAEFLNAHIFERFPGLNIALSEGQIGWIPHFLEQADLQVRHHSIWTGVGFGGRLPSEIFKEHVFGCFIEDKVGMACRRFMNIEMLGWESDYPHSDGIWPNGPEILSECLEGLAEDEIEKITHQNAARFFQFEPFTRRSPETCTVQALRAEVSDWDTSTQSRFKHRASQSPMAQLQARVRERATAISR